MNTRAALVTSSWIALLVGCSGSTSKDGSGTGGAAGGGASGGVGASGGNGAFGGSDGGGAQGGTGAFGGAAGSGAVGGIAGSGAFGGVAGSGGLGGTAGVAGSGGFQGVCSPFSPPQPACGSVCGNAKQDSCSNCPDGGGFGGIGGMGGGPPGGGTGGVWCSSAAEECDGSDFAGKTCQSLGYLGGTLGCTSWCARDTSACQRCYPASGHLLGCDQSVASAKHPSAFALAATEQEIAIAWVSRDVAQPETWFARFKPDLTLISKSGPFEPSCATSLALAARPGGWVLASGGTAGVKVTSLDSTGKQTASFHATNTGHAPTLAGRPGAGPLLVWNEAKKLASAVVAADGSTATIASYIPMPQENDYAAPAAVFVDNGWLVSTRTGSQVVVARVEANGSSNGVLQKPAPNNTENPALDFANGTARLVYDSFGGTPSVELVMLDDTGKAKSSKVVLGTTPTYFNDAFPVAVGDDTVVLLGSYTGGAYQAAYLDVRRVSALGQTVWNAEKVAADPSWLTQYRAVARGSEIVVGFVAGTTWASGPAGGAAFSSGIGLARVKP